MGLVPAQTVIEVQLPNPMEELDTRQAAKLMNVPWSDFLAYYKSGQITNKYVRKDPATGKWIVNRCDLEDLKLEIETHRPGVVTHIVKGPQMVTLKEMSETTGIEPATLAARLRVRGIEPSGKRGRSFVYPESAVEDVQKSLPKMSQSSETVTITDIAEFLGVTPNAVHARMYQGRWPQGFEPIGKQGRFHLYNKDILEAFRNMDEAPQSGYPTEGVNMWQIAKALNITLKSLQLRRSRGQWPEEFAEPIAREGAAYIYDAAIIEAMKDDVKPRAKVVSHEIRPDSVSIVGSAKTNNVNYFQMAMEIREAGFEDAAIWVVKNKC